MSDKEVLTVTSKLKKYIKESHGLSTAGNVPEALSSIIRQLVDKAADSAKSQGRKTLMDRDFE